MAATLLRSGTGCNVDRLIRRRIFAAAQNLGARPQPVALTRPCYLTCARWVNFAVFTEGC